MDRQLIEAAKAVLGKNWTGQFAKAAPGIYAQKCNWDAAFIAIGYAHYKQDRAEAELRSLFGGQWKNGMLPQTVFGEENGTQSLPAGDCRQSGRLLNAPESSLSSGISMPPVQGFALKSIYDKAEDKVRALAFLREMYPKVLALHRYLYQYRDPRQEGLVYIRHPREAGTENSPAWDRLLKRIDLSAAQNPFPQRKDPQKWDNDLYTYLRDLYHDNNYDEKAIQGQCPFQVQDPLFNAMLCWSNESLIQVGGMLKKDVSEIIHWHELTIYSMNEKLWDGQRAMYNAFDLWGDEIIPVHTSAGLMPLVGEVPTQEQAEQMLLRLEIDFQELLRGPVSINMNWMLYHGLLRYDFEEPAARLKKDTLELMSEHGFYSCSAALCIDLLSGG